MAMMSRLAKSDSSKDAADEPRPSRREAGPSPVETAPTQPGSVVVSEDDLIAAEATATAPAAPDPSSEQPPTEAKSAEPASGGLEAAKPTALSPQATVASGPTPEVEGVGDRDPRTERSPASSETSLASGPHASARDSAPPTESLPSIMIRDDVASAADGLPSIVIRDDVAAEVPARRGRVPEAQLAAAALAARTASPRGVFVPFSYLVIGALVVAAMSVAVTLALYPSSTPAEQRIAEKTATTHAAPETAAAPSPSPIAPAEPAPLREPAPSASALASDESSEATETEGETEEETDEKTAASEEGDEKQSRTVRVRVLPFEAAIYSGGQELGRGAVDIEVTPGKRRVLVARADGYATRKIVVDGKKRQVTVSLPSKRPPKTATGADTPGWVEAVSSKPRKRKKKSSEEPPAGEPNPD